MQLDEYLFRNKMSVSALSRMVDYNPVHIREYICGRNRISKKLARKIEQVTEGVVTVKELLEKNPEKGKKVLLKNEEL